MELVRLIMLHAKHTSVYHARNTSSRSQWNDDLPVVMVLMNEGTNVRLKVMWGTFCFHNTKQRPSVTVTVHFGSPYVEWRFTQTRPHFKAESWPSDLTKSNVIRGCKSKVTVVQSLPTPWSRPGYQLSWRITWFYSVPPDQCCINTFRCATVASF
jgi:hypothetical protein